MQEQLRTLALSRTFILTPNGLSEPHDQDGELISTAALPDIIDSKYKILSQIGEGGMGTVYRAHHLLLARDVALKTLRAGKVPPDAFERFNREVQSVAKLDSRNVVRVFDFGLTQSNLPYYTMELLEGESLADRLERDGQLSIAEAIAVFTDVANGLCSAHAKGIVHRDLKPANIFLELKNGKIQTAKVVDFGIAKLSQGVGGQQLTLGGAVYGSPLYMSPEQSQGEGTDKRSDVYSFGCSLFEALTGEPPYVGNNAFETILMHQTARIPKLAKRDARQTFPGWLETLSASCMTKDRDLRVQSFQEVLDVFETYKDDLSRPAAHNAISPYRRTQQADSYYDPDTEEDDPGARAEENDFHQRQTGQHASTRRRREEQAQTTEYQQLTRESDKQLKMLIAMGLLVVGVGLTAVVCVIFPVGKVKMPDLPNPAASVSKSESKPEVKVVAPISVAPNTAQTGHDSVINAADAIAGLNTQAQIPAPPAEPIEVPTWAKRFKHRAATISAENFDTLANSDLTDIDIQRCVIDNNAIGKLSKLNLQILRLGYATLNDKGALQLTNCKHLSMLAIEGTHITDAGLIPLTELKSLSWLDIRRTEITDRSMEAVAKMRQLTNLSVSGTKITESGLRLVCSSCKHLRKVEVAGCENISSDIIHYLRLEYPHIDFVDKEKPARGFNDL